MVQSLGLAGGRLPPLAPPGMQFKIWFVTLVFIVVVLTCPVSLTLIAIIDLEATLGNYAPRRVHAVTRSVVSALDARVVLPIARAADSVALSSTTDVCSAIANAHESSQSSNAHPPINGDSSSEEDVSSAQQDSVVKPDAAKLLKFRQLPATWFTRTVEFDTAMSIAYEPHLSINDLPTERFTDSDDGDNPANDRNSASSSAPSLLPPFVTAMSAGTAHLNTDRFSGANGAKITSLVATSRRIECAALQPNMAVFKSADTRSSSRQGGAGGGEGTSDGSDGAGQDDSDNGNSNSSLFAGSLVASGWSFCGGQTMTHSPDQLRSVEVKSAGQEFACGCRVLTPTAAHHIPFSMPLSAVTHKCKRDDDGVNRTSVLLNTTTTPTEQFPALPERFQGSLSRQWSASHIPALRTATLRSHCRYHAAVVRHGTFVAPDSSRTPQQHHVDDDAASTSKHSGSGSSSGSSQVSASSTQGSRLTSAAPSSSPITSEHEQESLNDEALLVSRSRFNPLRTNVVSPDLSTVDVGTGVVVMAMEWVAGQILQAADSEDTASVAIVTLLGDDDWAQLDTQYTDATFIREGPPPTHSSTGTAPQQSNGTAKSTTFSSSSSDQGVRKTPQQIHRDLFNSDGSRKSSPATYSYTSPYYRALGRNIGGLCHLGAPSASDVAVGHGCKLLYDLAPVLFGRAGPHWGGPSLSQLLTVPDKLVSSQGFTFAAAPLWNGDAEIDFTTLPVEFQDRWSFQSSQPFDINKALRRNTSVSNGAKPSTAKTEARTAAGSDEEMAWLGEGKSAQDLSCRPQWFAIVAIPTPSRVAFIIKTRADIVVSAFAMGAVAVILLLILMRTLIQPLRGLSKAIACCASLELDAIELMEASAIAEIAEIQRTVAFLAVRLYHFRRFLPEKAVLTAASEEADALDALLAGADVDALALSQEEAQLDVFFDPDHLQFGHSAPKSNGLGENVLLDRRGDPNDATAGHYHDHQRQQRKLVKDLKRTPQHKPQRAAAVPSGMTPPPEDDDYADAVNFVGADASHSHELTPRPRINMPHHPDDNTDHAFEADGDPDNDDFDMVSLNSDGEDVAALYHSFDAHRGLGIAAETAANAADVATHTATIQIRFEPADGGRQCGSFEFRYRLGDAVHNGLIRACRIHLGLRPGVVLHLFLTDEDGGTRQLTNNEDTFCAFEHFTLPAIGTAFPSLRVTVIPSIDQQRLPPLIAATTVGSAVSRLVLSGNRMTESDQRVQVAGVILLVLLAMQVAQNGIVTAYLQKRFAALDGEFRAWYKVSKFECYVGLLLGVFNVTNFEVLASQLCVGRWLAFTAPLSPELLTKVRKYSLIGFLLGDFIPFIVIVIEAVLRETYQDPLVLLSVGMSTLSIVAISVRHGILRFAVNVAMMRNKKALRKRTNTAAPLSRKQCTVLKLALADEASLTAIIPPALVDQLYDVVHSTAASAARRFGGVVFDPNGLTCSIAFNATRPAPAHADAALRCFCFWRRGAHRALCAVLPTIVTAIRAEERRALRNVVTPRITADISGRNTNKDSDSAQDKTTTSAFDAYCLGDSGAAGLNACPASSPKAPTVDGGRESVTALGSLAMSRERQSPTESRAKGRMKAAFASAIAARSFAPKPPRALSPSSPHEPSVAPAVTSASGLRKHEQQAADSPTATTPTLSTSAPPMSGASRVSYQTLQRRHRPMASIVTGSDMIVGSIGTLMSQTFQHVGDAAALSSNLLHLNEIVGSSCVCNAKCAAAVSVDAIERAKAAVRRVDQITMKMKTTHEDSTTIQFTDDGVAASGDPLDCNVVASMSLSNATAAFTDRRASMVAPTTGNRTRDRSHSLITKNRVRSVSVIDGHDSGNDDGDEFTGELVTDADDAMNVDDVFEVLVTEIPDAAASARRLDELDASSKPTSGINTNSHFHSNKGGGSNGAAGSNDGVGGLLSLPKGLVENRDGEDDHWAGRGISMETLALVRWFEQAMDTLLDFQDPSRLCQYVAAVPTDVVACGVLRWARFVGALGPTHDRRSRNTEDSSKSHPSKSSKKVSPGGGKGGKLRPSPLRGSFKNQAAGNNDAPSTEARPVSTIADTMEPLRAVVPQHEALLFFPRLCTASLGIQRHPCELHSTFAAMIEEKTSQTDAGSRNNTDANRRSMGRRRSSLARMESSMFSLGSSSGSYLGSAEDLVEDDPLTPVERERQKYAKASRAAALLSARNGESEARSSPHQQSPFHQSPHQASALHQPPLLPHRTATVQSASADIDALFQGKTEADVEAALERRRRRQERQDRALRPALTRLLEQGDFEVHFVDPPADAPVIDI